MKVVTVISDKENREFVDFLLYSCMRLDLDLVVLYANKYTNHRVKDSLLMNYLFSQHADEIIMFVDGYDTMFLASESEIIDKYLRFNAPIVFSAEINCWPYQELSFLYPKTNTYFKFLNSGGFIGRSGIIRDILALNPSPPINYGFLKKMKWFISDNLYNTEINPYNKYQWSNQFYWHNIYLKNQKIIKLDHHSELFYTLSTELRKLKNRSNLLLYEETNRIKEELIFVNNRIRSNITQSFPCHIHFNGPIPKSLMEDEFFMRLKQ